MIVLLVIGGFIAFGVLVVVFVYVGVFKVSGEQAKAERNADVLLDEAFDGRPDVSFDLNMGTMKFDTVVLGAKERGYALTHQALNEHGAGTLLFEKP